MKMRLSFLIAALSLPAISCGFFSRKPNHFYSLETLPPVGTVRNTAGLPVGVDGIELPPGIDRREIVLRGDGNALEVRGTHQWASSLEEMVTHTLAFDLANRLPEGLVVLPGQAKPPAGSMRSLYVTFEDLAPGPDGQFVLDARWTIDRGTAHHERIAIPLASTESAAIVTAMSQALAQLADRVVAAL